MDTTGSAAMEGEEEEMIKSIKPLTICILIFTFCGSFGLFMSFRGPLSDFGNYYYGSRIAFTEKDHFSGVIYNVSQFNARVQEMGQKGLFLNHNTVTPQTTIIYRCLSWIDSPGIAKIIFNAAGLILFSLVFFRFLRWKSIEPSWPFVVVILAAQVPLFYNLSFGQTYLFITTALMLAVMQAEKRPWLSGLLLGLAISLKVSPAIFLIWFLTQRRYAVIVWSLITCVLILLLLWVNVGLQFESLEFALYSLPRMMDGFITDPFTSSFQSVVVFLRKMMLPDTILNASPIIAGNERLVQLINTLVFIALSYVLVGAWKQSQDMRRMFLLLILFLSITSGYTSTYSLILLLPFVVVGNTRQDWIRAGMYSVLFILPPRIFDGYSPFLEEYKLWIFIALFIWEAKVEFGFRRIEKMQMVLAGFLMCMVILKFAHRPEQLPLTYYKPDVVKQDYVLNAYVAGHTVHYVAYADGGFQEFSVPFSGNAYMESTVSYYQHKVYWRTIGSTETDYLVLSDYHRGPGLYHLYTISKSEFKSISGQ